MEILRCERGQGQGTPFGGKCLFNPDTFRTRAGLRCADLPWRARHVVFLLEMFRMVGRDHAWPFRMAPGWGSALRRGALRPGPRLQTCHVTYIRVKPRRSLTNIIIHPPVFTPPWYDLTPAEPHSRPFHVWMMFSTHQWHWGRSGLCDDDDGCQLTSSPAHLCTHSNLVLCLTVRCVLFLTCFYITKK